LQIGLDTPVNKPPDGQITGLSASAALVSRTRCSALRAAPQSRDLSRHLQGVGPGISSATRRKGGALRCIRETTSAAALQSSTRMSAAIGGYKGNIKIPDVARLIRAACAFGHRKDRSVRAAACLVSSAKRNRRRHRLKSADDPEADRLHSAYGRRARRCKNSGSLCQRRPAGEPMDWSGTLGSRSASTKRPASSSAKK
jgi:hypothetical protein